MISLLFSSVFAAQIATAQSSIQDLASMSKMMIHHYDCRLALLAASGASKELPFQINPTSGGHQQTDYSIAMGADKVVASVNAQMLGVVWTRNNQTIANSQAWTQNSTTQSFVLMVGDPKDENTQVHVSCNGVTFAEVKK